MSRIGVVRQAAAQPRRCGFVGKIGIGDSHVDVDLQSGNTTRGSTTIVTFLDIYAARITKRKRLRCSNRPVTTGM